MKQDAVLFIDVDDSAAVRYTYREPHFAAARALGLVCLTAGVAGRTHLQRLRDDSDAVFLLETLSERAILDLVGQLDGQYQVRAIFCQAGHPSAQGEVGCIVAQACERLGLVHSRPDAIAACNNKFLMRKALKQHGLLSVPFALCSDEQALQQGAERVGYPLIAKPPFGGASAFIKKCSNWEELRSHYAHFVCAHGTAAYADFYGCAHTLEGDEGQPQDYVPGRSLLLEGFIPGVEGSVECVVVGERIHPLLINEKLLLTERSGTVLENLLISPPTSFTPAQCVQIRAYAVACLRAVGLTHAVVHFEFRMTDAGPVVIEINPRVGGLYVNAAFRDLAGIDPYRLYLAMLLGEQGIDAQLDAAARRVAEAGQHYSMLAIYPDCSGEFKGIEGVAFLDNHPSVLEYAQQAPGHAIDADIEEHYLLKCWAQVDDAAAAQALHDAILQNLRVIIDTPVMGIAQISAQLREQRYCHRRDFGELLNVEPGEAQSFKAYWANLVRDEAFKDYTHRERRILRYRLLPSRQLQINRDTAFKSPVTYAVNYRQGVNHLSYCEEGFIEHPLLQKLLATDLAVIGPHLGEHAYTIDIHQFRVRAEGQSSSPTTSGIHQDGLDWVFMHFIGEHNTVPVVSEVFSDETEHSRLLNTPMAQFLETIVINDRGLYHRAGNVRPNADSTTAWRDVLLVSLRGVPADAEGQPA